MRERAEKQSDQHEGAGRDLDLPLNFKGLRMIEPGGKPSCLPSVHATLEQKDFGATASLQACCIVCCALAALAVKDDGRRRGVCFAQCCCVERRERDVLRTGNGFS